MSNKKGFMLAYPQALIQQNLIQKAMIAMAAWRQGFTISRMEILRKEAQFQKINPKYSRKIFQRYGT